LLVGKTVTSIAAGASHTCVIASGEAYCWGVNNYGQLGNGTTTQSTTPVKVSQAANYLLNRTVTDISVGSGHSCAVADNEAYCWGYNAYGQLGGNGTTQSTTPIKAVGQMSNRIVTDVSSGGSYTCAIASGEAYCWGQGTSGQLGIGDVSNYSTPVKVTQSTGLLLGKTITRIDAGTQHTCAIAGSEAYCWGENSNFNLGNGTSARSLVPVKVNTASMPGSVTAISIGNVDSTCAVSNALEYCWGANTYRQFGIGDVALTTGAAVKTQTGEVGITSVLFDGSAATVTSRDPTVMKLTAPAHTAGSVDVALSGEHIQSLTLSAAYTYAEPPTITNINPVSGSTAGGDIITITGTNFVSGSTVKFDGVLSSSVTFVNPTTLTARAPAGNIGKVMVVVTTPDQQKAKAADIYEYVGGSVGIVSVDPTSGSIAGGQAVTITGSGFAGMQVASRVYTSNNNSTCGILNNEAYCWGSNGNGQLGDSSTTTRMLPTKVTQAVGLLAGKTATDIVASDLHSCTVASGEAYCWGYNGNGQLGNDTLTNSTSPVKVQQATGLLAGKTITGITASNYQTCAVASGEAYCWGYNGNGQLGDGTTTDRKVPIKVTQTTGLLAGKTVQSITMGSNHACAIADGEAYCWGNNTYGQLGNNSTTQSLVPVKVTQAAGLLAGKTVTKIVASYNYTCAVASGETYCWGYNSSGQLGDGTTNTRTAPVKVVQSADVLAGKTVTSIAASNSHKIGRAHV
jgi:alpha-tubulin suppressor-like RCC1 family protein